MHTALSLHFCAHTTTNPSELENLWDWLCQSQLALPFVMPDGSKWIRLHRGIPSGLFLTQWLDSHYNLVMLLTILSSLGFDITTIWIKVQGDDSITAFRIFIPANQHDSFKLAFEQKAKHYFDAVARPSKTQMSNTPEGLEVLGYKNSNGLPTRSWHKLLAQLLYSKGRKPSYEKLMARAIGITYADCDQHSEVRNVCKDVYDYLYNLGYRPDPAGLSSLPFFIEEGELEFDLSHFPSSLEITRYLRSFHQHSEENARRFWPAHFLSDR